MSHMTGWLEPLRFVLTSRATSCDRVVKSLKVRGRVLWCLSSVKGNIKKSRAHIWRPHPLLELVKCSFLCNLTQSDAKKKRDLTILWKVSSCCVPRSVRILENISYTHKTEFPALGKISSSPDYRCVVMTPPAGLNATGLLSVLGSVLVKNCVKLTVKLFNDSQQHSKIFFYKVELNHCHYFNCCFSMFGVNIYFSEHVFFLLSAYINTTLRVRVQFKIWIRALKFDKRQWVFSLDLKEVIVGADLWFSGGLFQICSANAVSPCLVLSIGS